MYVDFVDPLLTLTTRGVPPEPAESSRFVGDSHVSFLRRVPVPHLSAARTPHDPD